MPFQTKPDALPKWATTAGVTYITTPSAPKQEQGWIDEKPPLQWFNWLHLKTYQWLKYFENRTDSALAQYDAVVGAGSYCSHASLNAVMADVGVATIKNILVIDHPILATTQIINQSNVRIEFKRSAVLTKGAATTGIQINADGCEIIGAKFSGYNVALDKPLEILVTKKNNLVFGCRFFDCIADIADNGLNNTLQANVIEV